jgi:calpain
MSFQDFIRNYTTLEICMLGADSALDASKVAFASRCEDGAWNSRISAGGCRNFIDSFHKNPQYR